MMPLLLLVFASATATYHSLLFQVISIYMFFCVLWFD
jgi:hypothetical protein